jgi:translation initiation factor 2 gamma subunit (eIF-2gamma)
MRLIDADRLKAEIMGWCVVTDDLFGMGKYHEREIVLQAIEESPTIDAVPVVRGEWEIAIGYDPNKKVQCQNCYKTACEPTSYCPNCGAKMEDKPCG